MRHVVVGTAGHIDHGKTSLVKALTGTDTDRLPEEKARGITIDLGFAFLEEAGELVIEIVDVPGHERFVRNMLAGAGGIDLALLVVAADEGVMPQTREHLAILDLLGVRRGVVALTKCDLADDDWLDIVEADITDTLAGTTLAGSPIVRCSSVTRAGLEALLAALDAAVEGLPPRRDAGRPRLPIDRVFTIGGFGTVVTGTLIDGALAPGDEVEVMPAGRRGRIRGIQSHRDSVERALPGMRTAVNITGIAKDDLRRGDILAKPGTVRATSVIDARLRAVAGCPQPVRHNMAVTFHCYADEVNARVRLLDCDELRPGDEGWAQIRLERPSVALRGDRFVLRTPNDTIAGGIVADAAPKRHRRQDPATLAALASMLSDRPVDLVYDAVARAPFVRLASLAAELAMPPDDITAAITELVDAGAIVQLGPSSDERLVTAAHRDELARRTHEALAAYHREHPLRTGMPAEELRTRLGIDRAALSLLLDALRDVAVAASAVALASFVPAPTPQQQARIDAWLALLKTLASNGAAPDLEPDLLAYLVERGRIVDAGDGVYFDAAAFDRMVELVRGRVAERGAITLAEARDLFGTSRRYAQAALEQMDRLRITRRTGDTRVLR